MICHLDMSHGLRNEPSRVPLDVQDLAQFASGIHG